LILYTYILQKIPPLLGGFFTQPGGIADNRVEMSCMMFDPNSFLRTTGTANRAAVMLHEATHMRYADFWGTEPHDDEDNSRDEWNYHGLLMGKILYGQAGVVTISPLSLKHSPYQIQIEFLSDIAEFANYWVPYSVYGFAADVANRLMEVAIIGDPGWRCGEPRPM